MIEAESLGEHAKPGEMWRCLQDTPILRAVSRPPQGGERRWTPGQYNAARMGRAMRTVVGLGVAIYLTGAGWFFILAPWSQFWSSRVLAGVPFWLVPLLASPLLRGALGGFGVLHFAVAFVWLDGALRKQ